MSECRRGDVFAEDDRAPGAGRGKLDHAEVVLAVVVGVEPPPEAAVKALGAIDVRNRDDGDLQLHVDRRYFCGLDYSFTLHLSIAHVDTPLGLHALRVATHVKPSGPQRRRAV
jgi:hypothetical protein